MKLNSDQQRAFDCIVEFLEEPKNSDASRFYLLDGPGGSGKTTTIKSICKFAKQNRKSYSVLAPTHKACGVLRKDIPGVQTIAKFLGFSQVVKDDGTIEDVYNYKNSVKLDFLVIDECSMISKKQCDILINEVTYKIIFIGDDCQLPPVGELSSKVYDLDFYGRNTLSKNMRSDCLSLAEYMLTFRDAVTNKKLPANFHKNLEFGIKDHQDYLDAIVKSFENEPDTVALAWTNKRVNYYCSYIRSKLFDVPEESLEKYYENEKLIFTEYYKTSGAIFYTNDIVQVENVEIYEENIYYPVCECKEPNGKCKSCGVTYHQVLYKTVKFYKLFVRTVDFNKKGIELLIPYSAQDKKDLQSVLYSFRDQCKIKMDKYYWIRYYQKLSHYNAPVNYSYASTVHKAQGSGYKNVFVDMDNILLNCVETEKLRLLYVAMSRPRNNLKFFKK